MAQEPDRLGAASAPAPGTTGTESPAEIERDIERTRAEMTETIDALGARFEPSYIKEQAQEAIVDTARSAGTSMMDTIKDNPLPAAIAALSVGWLIANRSSGTPPARTDRYAPQPSYGGRGYAATQVGVYGGGTTASGASLTDQARDKASGLVDQARDTASGLADDATATASNLADQARGTASDLAHEAQGAARQAESWLDDQIQRNPLGVGAVAVVAGALVGMSLPETQVETNLMGSQARQVVDQAKQVAGEKLDQAKQVASRVADEAKEKAGEIAQDVKADAREVAQTAKSEARSVADGGPSAPPVGASRTT